MNTLNKSGDTTTTMLNRDWVIRLVQKYYLGGLFNQVSWMNTNGLLSVNEVTPDGKLAIFIEGRCDNSLKEFPRIPIPNTRMLIQSLRVFDDQISINIFNPSDYGLEYVMSPEMEIADKTSSLIMILETKYELPRSPKEVRPMKWDFQESFKTIDFLNYIRSKGDRFKNKRNDDREHLFKFKPVKWFDFNGYHLRRVLESNTDVEVFGMKVSEDGLCHISFRGDDIQSDYYLITYY